MCGLLSTLLPLTRDGWRSSFDLLATLLSLTKSRWCSMLNYLWRALILDYPTSGRGRSNAPSLLTFHFYTFAPAFNYSTATSSYILAVLFFLYFFLISSFPSPCRIIIISISTITIAQSINKFFNFSMSFLAPWRRVACQSLDRKFKVDRVGCHGWFRRVYVTISYLTLVILQLSGSSA